MVGELERRKKFKKDHQHRKKKPVGRPEPGAGRKSATGAPDADDLGSDDDDDAAGFSLDPALPNLTGDSAFGNDDDSDDHDEDAEMDDDVEEDDDEDDDEGVEDLMESDAEEDANSEGGDEESDSEFKSKRTRLRSEISSHKEELEKMKEKDPVFYQFLMENDPELLRFDDDDEAEATSDVDGMEQDEDDEDAEDDDDVPVPRRKVAANDAAADGTEVITRQMVNKWKQALIQSHSVKAARKMVTALNAALGMGEADSDKKSRRAYRVEDKAVYNQIIITAMKYVGPTVSHHLPTKTVKGKKALPSAAPKWKKLSTLVKSFVKASVKILQQITDEGVLTFVLKELQCCVSLFACFPKVGKEYLKVCPIIIGGLYTTFSTASRGTNVHTWSAIIFMINCLVEIMGIDVGTTYHFGFTYIRQLAILLRNAITSGSKEAFKNVYNWPFVHCMRLWAAVLGCYCERGSGPEAGGGEALKPLIYPFVQVVLGVIRLKPSAKHFPFRFQCLKVLNDISRTTHTFIPLASNFFEIFESAEMKRSGKPSTLKQLDFTLALKAPAEYIGTRVYQVGVAEEFLSLIIDHYDCFALSISFPELAIPAIFQFRRFVKHSKNFVVNKQIQQLIDALESNSKFIEIKRAEVDFSPKDEGRADAFSMNLEPLASPLRKYATSRRKIRAENASSLRTRVQSGGARKSEVEVEDED
ncbi:Nucleolar Complex 2 protein [Irineochytrium annulatum]|nr:Nucleolar Complex 2 protein [Irineochytrium annulatum]